MKPYFFAFILSNISINCFAQLPDKTIKTGNPIIVPALIIKPGKMQTNLQTQTILPSSKDNILYAKDLAANPIEDLGAELSPGQIMKANQILRYKLPGTADKYCTLKLSFSDVVLFDNNHKLIWSTNLHANQIDNLKCKQMVIS